MQVHIQEAAMTRSKEEGYVGRVYFQVESHSKAYELTLQSKSGRDWSYALNFMNDPGSEEEIEAVEAAIEEDDDMFDQLVEAARSKLDN